MRNKIFSCILTVLIVSICSSGCKTSQEDPYRLAVPVYAALPYDTHLDAVKWTHGFWHDRMEKLRNIYFPGVMDSSFISVRNGSTFRNFPRAAGLEEGGWLGKVWGDGDCYFVLDVASRLYAYEPDEYFKSKLDYWIPIIADIQDERGIVDTRMSIEKQSNPDFTGNQYNVAHMYKAAISNYRATGDTLFLSVAAKYLEYYIGHSRGVSHQVTHACGQHYSLTGNELALATIKKYYSPDKQGSVFGPPFLQAKEVFGHNTQASHELNGATWLVGLTGDTAYMHALKQLADNLLSSKMYITGAVAPVQRLTEPLMIDGKEYRVNMHEAVGYAYDLPNETAYCESCGQNLFMEFFFRMFRLTGETKYMDAVERMLYNTVSGCIDLDKPGFFYANPQEQFETSMRFDSSSHAEGKYHYTWKRTLFKQASCCPPKAMRGIAMTNEIAYSLTDNALWVNLYGSNSFSSPLPGGGMIACKQESDYPWDGTISLSIEKIQTRTPVDIMLRIPGWLNSAVDVKVNGVKVMDGVEGGKYVTLSHAWKKGDKIEMQLPMPVRFMITDPKVNDNLGKIAVMRGPVVYCLEDADIPAGEKIESLFITGVTGFKEEKSGKLGGVVELKGTLIKPAGKYVAFNTSEEFQTGTGLYHEVRIADKINAPDNSEIIKVSLVPFYSRLNRESRYFRVWIPTAGEVEM
jgi:DUF1680 family protein